MFLTSLSRSTVSPGSSEFDTFVPKRPASSAGSVKLPRHGRGPMLSRLAKTLKRTPELWQEAEKPMVALKDIPEVGTAAQGVADVEECLSWMKPRKRDGGFISSLARLSVEVNACSRDWHAQRRPDEVVEEVPLDPMHTAEAASLLLRMVRSLPARLPLKAMLEPVTQVLLRSIYCAWPWMPSIADTDQSEVMLETILEFVPFFTLVKGHREVTETSKGQASAAVAEAEALRKTTAVAVKELEMMEGRVAQLEEKADKADMARVAAEKRFATLQIDHKKLSGLLVVKDADLADAQNSHTEVKQDLRTMTRDSKLKDGIIGDLRKELQFLRADNAKLDTANVWMTAELQRQKSDIDQMPRLKEKIESYESDEAVHGVAFAVRVSKDVLGLTLPDICGVSEDQLTRRNSTGSAKAGMMKLVLDNVCNRLKLLPLEIKTLKTEIEGLHEQVKEYSRLIPIWNQDVVEDLEDAYNQDAAVHRKVFSEKDHRSFAGLGKGADVPQYLRAEGVVRHVFVSKAELEDFMQEFTERFFHTEPGDNAVNLSTESMHKQLYEHMRLRFVDKKEKDVENPEALTEFAYAFICGLEAYRDDPDFELFDLMLSGAVHPSIMQDQREMLQSMEALTRTCQEPGLEEEKARPHKRKGAGGDPKEQVSRRIIRAVLEVVFPDKSRVRHDALRKALFLTMEMLDDAGKTPPTADYVYTKDLFENTADGSQTPLVEEIRRQHVYEVIGWTCELSRKMLNGRHLTDSSATIQNAHLLDIIQSLDPHRSHANAVELAHIGCPDHHKYEHVREVLQRLRQGVLLRPKRLWIRSESKEVVKHLLAQGRGSVSSVSGGGGQRNKALKVLDNPIHIMESDEYNNPDSLEQVIARSEISHVDPNVP